MLKKTQYSYSGMKIIEHNFNVPIDYFKSNSKTINIFAREISDNQNNYKDLPFLLFLQGGPGYESPRPLIKSGK